MVLTSVVMIIDSFDNVVTVYLFILNGVGCFKSPLMFASSRPYFSVLAGIFLSLRTGPVA